MAMFKKMGASFFGAIFVMILSTVIFMVPIVNLTSYDSAKGMFIEAFTKAVPENQTEGTLTALKLQCSMAKTDNITLPMDKQNLTLNCAEVVKAGSPADFYQLVGGTVFNNTYFKQYNCSFFNCIKNGQQTVLFSEYGHNYLNSLMIYMYIALAVSAILLLVCSDLPFGAMKNFGISMIFVGASYFMLGLTNTALTKMFSNVPAQVISSVQKVVGQIFDYTAEKLLMILVAGIILTIIGFIGGIFYGKPKKSAKKEKSNKD